MARTKASVGARFATGKSSKARCNAAPPSSSTGSAGTSDKSSRGSSGGGNPVCPRETPTWQKPITRFFGGASSGHSSDGDKNAGPSSRTSKPKVINDDRQLKESETSRIHDNDADKSQNGTISDENEDSNNAERRKRLKKNIIQSDDEDETVQDQSKDRDLENEITTAQSDEELDRPKNQVLEESIILEPLNGEDSHKIDEYYRFKNKGEGKKSKAINEDMVLTSNKSFKKRCLDDKDDTEHVSKKVKVGAIV